MACASLFYCALQSWFSNTVGPFEPWLGWGCVCTLVGEERTLVTFSPKFLSLSVPTDGDYVRSSVFCNETSGYGRIKDFCDLATRIMLGFPSAQPYTSRVPAN